MHPPRCLLVLGLGACVLARASEPHEPHLAASRDDAALQARADVALDNHDLLPVTGQLRDFKSCDDYNCFCQHGMCYEEKGTSCDRDASCEIKAVLFCPQYRNFPRGYSPPARCRREVPAISDTSSGHLLEHGSTVDAQDQTAAIEVRRAESSPHKLLVEQCNAEASEAMEVIMQNYLDDLVDNSSQDTSANVPCSQVVLHDITGQDEDIAGRLSKLWQLSDQSDPTDHHDSHAPFRGNDVNAITVLTRKDPMLMNTTLAINPKRHIKNLADFDGETCVVNMLAAVVPPDDQSKTPTLKVTLSSEGNEDHTETWSCATGTSLEKTLIIMERDQSRPSKSDPFIHTIPDHATIGQTFSVDSSSIPFDFKGPLTVTATSPPGYSGTIILYDRDKPRVTVEVQASTDYQQTPPAVIVTKSALGYYGSYTAPLPSATSGVDDQSAPTPGLEVRTAVYKELEALHILKKQECQDRILLHPASKGQKCKMTVDFEGRAIKATLTATATQPPGWSAKIKDNHKHTGTLQWQFLSDRMLLTADTDDLHTTITVQQRAHIAANQGADAAATPLNKNSHGNRLYPGLPSRASSGEVFTTTVNLDGREIAASGSITATSPTGFVMTIKNDTAAATLYAELDEAQDPVMLRGSIFEDGMVATINEPWLPGGFTGIVNPGILNVPNPRPTEAHLQARQKFTPATTSATTLPTVASVSDQVVTTTTTTTVTMLASAADPSTITESPVTFTNTVMSLGDKIIPITGSSRQVVNNTIMTVVYPPRANLDPAACDRNRLIALDKTLGFNTASPEFTNLTVYRALHPEYNWNAVKHYADQLKPEITGGHASQLAILCMRNGDQKFTSASCPCSAMMSTTIDGNVLVSPGPSPAVPFTPSAAHVTATVVQIGSTVLPYNASTTYPSGARTEVVFVSPATSLADTGIPNGGTGNLTITHYSTAKLMPTAAPTCGGFKHMHECRMSKCLWNHLKPINITTVMPALMDDPYDGHMMYDYFTQHTSLAGRPHWGTTEKSGLYYPTRLATHSASGIYIVRETPTGMVKKRSLLNPEPVVHSAPACFDEYSCYTVCREQDKHHSKVKLIGGTVGGGLVGALLLIAGLGALAMTVKRRRRATADPASRATPAMQTVDPVTGQPVTQVVGNDSLGRTTAVDPTTGAAGTKPALRGNGTLGRQAEEGRGRVHFGEEQPGGGAQGATSAGSGTGHGIGSGTEAGTAGGTAGHATSAAGAQHAANSTPATPDAAPTSAAAASKTVAQPGTATSHVVGKTAPDASGKMAHVPEDSAEHVEAVPAHDGADSHRTGSEMVDMGSIRGRRKLRPDDRAFD